MTSGENGKTDSDLSFHGDSASVSFPWMGLAMERPHPRDIARFLRRVWVSPSGCWLWTGFCQVRNGYGQFWCGGKVCLTHRFSYAAFRGAIPQGLTIDHRSKCERRCVNPDHLRLASHADNCVSQLNSKLPCEEPGQEGSEVPF